MRPDRRRHPRIRPASGSPPAESSPYRRSRRTFVSVRGTPRHHVRAQQRGDNGPGPTRSSFADRLQRLQFRIESSARNRTSLRPWSCRTPPSHATRCRIFPPAHTSPPCEPLRHSSESRRLRRQFLRRWRPARFSKSTSLGFTKHRMGVRIDEAGQNDFAVAINLGDLSCDSS